MTYSKGGKFISIELHDLLGGKKPGLYIGEGYQLIKVGSFASEEKAQMFAKQLEIFFGDRLVKEKSIFE